MINEQVFFALNPWQALSKSSSPWKVEQGLVQRAGANRLIKQLDGASIQVVTGARRTGKTILLHQCIDHLLHNANVAPKNIFYLNFDDLAFRSQLKSNPHLLLEIVELFSGKALAEHSAPIYLFLDEVQKFPAYFDQLKLYYDTFRPKLRLILSGSAALEIGSQTAETFAGRLQQTRLFPFSVKEIIHHQFPELPLPSVLQQLSEDNFVEQELRKIQADSLSLQPKIRLLLRRALVNGLLPEVYLAENEARKLDYVRQYRMTYLERDIRSLAQVGNLEEFTHLLDLLILQIGSLLDKTRLASDLGIAQNTVRKYIGILEQTFLLEQVRPYVGHIRKRLVKSPKTYFFDVGFFGPVSGLNTYELLEKNGKIGAVFENLCLNELRKTISVGGQFPTIHFWRTPAGAEVDFVIETKRHLIPIEVKLSESCGQMDVKNLLKFKADYANQVRDMILLYNGVFKYSDNIIFLPLWML